MKNIHVRKAYKREGVKTATFEYRSDWPYISIGFGSEREYFIENLSLLIASGMGISSALSSISASVKTWKMKKITKFIEEAVNTGMPLWQSFQATNFFSDRVISLIRSGEEAGRLPEHLNLVTLQQQKEKKFKSRLRSALLYPTIVVFIAFVVALGSTWFVLPNIVSFFPSTVELPINTKILIWLGAFFKSYGVVAVPALIATLLAIGHLLFIFKPTKFIGDWFLFRIPGIRTLVQGIEIARLGYTFGALLQAGFQMNEALESIKEGTNYSVYKKFYTHIQENIIRGESFRTALTSYSNSDLLIPLPIQQLIFAAEQSGRLSETFIKIGLIFEDKTDAMSQDLSTVLEPIVLVIVGLLVGFVVSGILGPIYGLSQQI